jgi:hypothetical protein
MSRRNRDCQRLTAAPPGITAALCPGNTASQAKWGFGWARTIGGKAQTMYRGTVSMRSRFILTMTSNTLARLHRLPAT